MNEEDDDTRVRREATARNPLPKADELFHYTGRVDDENLIRMIAGEIFYFSNPAHLNDVNEFRLLITQKKPTETDPYFQITAGKPSGDTGTMNVFEDSRMAEFLTNFFNHQADDSVKNSRVLCLTDSNTKNLMWSHYGHNHKGIVLGFDWEKIRQPFFKVHYHNELSLTEFGAGLFEWEAPQRYRTKTSDWSHEDEWRVFEYTNDSEEVLFARLPDALKSITFGNRTPTKTIRRALQLVNRHKPRIKLRQIEITQDGLVAGELKQVKVVADNDNDSVTDELDRIGKLVHLEPKQAIKALRNIDLSLTHDQCDLFLDHLVWSSLLAGDVDSLNLMAEPFLPYLYESEESPFWAPVIAATCITQDALLLERTKRWAPDIHNARVSHFRRGDLTAKLSEIDIFELWFSFSKDKNNFVLIEAAIQHGRVFEPSAEKLFLKIGWKLAMHIHGCKDNPLTPDLQRICQVNLRIAERIGNTHDIEACKKMLSAFDVPSI